MLDVCDPGVQGELLCADTRKIVSAAHYIFTYIDRIPPHLQPSERDQQRQTTQFYVPKMGGNVAVHYNPYRQVAAVSLPNVGEMMKLADNRVKMVDVMKGQPQVKIVPGIEKIDNEKVECLVMDFVGDRRYILVDLTDVPEALQALEVTRLVPELDGGKEAPVSMVWYVQEDDNRRDSEPSIGNVHCRVFGHGWEEEGSGNAACAVAASITLQKHESIVKGVEQLSVEAKEGKDKLERKVFGVQQGELAGRPSTTAVEVDVKVEEDGTRRLSSIIVSGRCNFHSKGELLGA